ncbi:MAG: PEP-CTERM sorting domain-containing protein [Microcoleaceae cyanobacterium]
MKNLTAKIIGASVLTAGLLSVSATDAAAAVNCSTNDVTGSASCEGAFSGNDSNSDLGGLFNVDEWVEWAKVDNDSGTDGGLTVGGGGQSGTWSVSGIDSPFMIALKGGPSYSAYYMDGNTTSGDWNTDGLFKGNGKPGPGLSHFSVYIAKGDNNAEVPEPLTILGSGLALGFGAMFKKKQSNKA